MDTTAIISLALALCADHWLMAIALLLATQRLSRRALIRDPGRGLREAQADLESDNPYECVRSYRMSADSFQELLDLLEDDLQLRSKKRNAVTPLEQLAILLDFLAHGRTAAVQAKQFQRSAATIDFIRKRAMRILLQRLWTSTVKQPHEVPELHDKGSFPRFRFFSGAVGALDGTHIKVVAGYELEL